MKSVLFDFGGTLDSNGIAWKDNFLPIYRKHGVRVEQEKFDRAFYDADDSFHLRHNVSGMGFEETVILQVRDVFANLKIEDAAAASAVASDFLAGCRGYFRKNIPVLESLAAEFRLGVVSNFYGNMNSVLASEGLLKYFGAVADSRAVGAEKPGPAIFNYALERLGANPARSVMVGDNYKRDMEGAKNIGMKGAFLWGDRFAQGEPPAQAGWCALLRSLQELAQKLKEPAAL
ncbi:MAG: HAD family hydrolase [Elusimicrobiales bacterium]|nr:HAD family hydrolase [Elusimicrobiales bacterium]